VGKAEGDLLEASSLSLFPDMAMGLPAGCEVAASWTHLRDLSYLKWCSQFQTLRALDEFRSPLDCAESDRISDATTSVQGYYQTHAYLCRSGSGVGTAAAFVAFASS
jgi:hypothetical protein